MLETIAEAVDGAVPVIAGVSAGTAAAVDRLRPRRRRGGRDARHVPAAARLPRRPGRADRLLRRGRRGRRPARDALQQPRGQRRRPARASRSWRSRTASTAIVAVKECSGDVRRIPALIAAAPQLEILVGRRRLGARGLLRGRDGLGDGRGRRRAARVRRALRALRAPASSTPAREVYQRLLPLARFDMTPKLVQYFKAAQDEAGLAGGPCREPRLPLTDGRARGAAGRARGAARGRPCVRAARYLAAVDSHTEGMPTRVVTGGVGPIPGATMLERKLALRGARWTTCGCC